MTRRLRLAVAELTDVGRRRERNQDNVTHFIPNGEDLLARRGALFVVCDGMGGHAAGEIASDIAVRTIRDEYFREADEDVIGALSRAIQEANAAIYQHARNHAAHTGMGTTCVAVALVGGRAFFANIGDSRAYILRDGVLKQVTLDHSWVAEQVRAGVLTDEQARTHSHRNVITRSLGTQPEVTADLFIEVMREGDRVLLCSDGLHGYVPEQEIRKVVTDDEPEPGVRRLIDMANANGGPDNITAVLVHLLEVPAVTDDLKLPETAIVTRASQATPSRAVRTSTLADPAAAPQPGPDVPAANFGAVPPVLREVPRATASERSTRALSPGMVLRLAAVAALCLLSLGIWDVLAGPYAASNAASARARQDVASAQATAQVASTQSPSVALVALASLRQRLQGDLATLPLDTQARQQIQQALDSVVAPAVRNAVQAYNQQNLITVLPTSAVTTFAVTCGSATLASGPDALAAVGSATIPTGQTAAPVTVYARAAAGGALYRVDLAPGAATCGATPVVPQGVQALATDAAQLYALVEQSGKWSVLAIGAGDKPATKLAVPADQTHAPLTLAAHGGDFYVAFQNPQAGTGGIWHFAGSDLTKPTQVIPTPAAVASLSVSASGALFALLPDGTIVNWDAAGHMLAVPVALASPLLVTDPSVYVASTPVPTVPPTAAAATPTPEQASSSLTGAGTATPAPSATGTPGGSTATPAAASPTPAVTTATATPVGPPTLFSGSSSLSADRASAGNLVVGDGSVPRVVRFKVSGPQLQLAQQYVYGPPLVPLQGVTVSADGTQVFAWGGSQLVEVALPA